jgi:GNAT superfamily N-acetyltransferase
MTEVTSLIQEIKNALNMKNIFIKEEIIPEKKDIIILLTDNNDNLIGKINGGVEEFAIVENSEEIYKDAFSILWVKVEKDYQGHNLATFLIIYIIYLCKTNFGDINYIVLEDDTDETDQNKNIYVKLGFVYQKKKEVVMLENGQEMNVNNGGEMQLNVNNFFNDNIIEKLNKILVTLKNWNKIGGKRKTKTKTKTKKRKYSKKKKNGKKSSRRKN